jgi:hypothetical protein
LIRAQDERRAQARARGAARRCSLFINDLDAGAGRMGSGTQYTVNNQMVNATLMNIADNPTNVQLPGVYKNVRARSRRPCLGLLRAAPAESSLLSTNITILRGP